MQPEFSKAGSDAEKWSCNLCVGLRMGRARPYYRNEKRQPYDVYNQAGLANGTNHLDIKRSLFFLAGIISLIRAIMEMSEFYRQMITLLPGGLCLGVGLGLLSPLLMAFTPLGKKLYRQQIDRGVIPRDYFSPQSLCFKDDRITELRRLSSFDVMYDKVYCVKHDADGMYILLKGRRFFIIPNSAFPSDDRKREITDYIEKKITGKDR